ncbi:MAG: DUF2523 domain-containing protein [Alcaligenaceae bacterium]|nr:MAG: DUF2523 domain-containing protein [Alcaligenaceae bacterium]
MAAIISWFSDLFVAVFVSIWDLIKDAFSWLFDQCLSVAVSAIQAIDVSALSNVNAWGSLPADVINILGLLGVGTAVAIILGAISIRFVLQLIPFTRLGS